MDIQAVAVQDAPQKQTPDPTPIPVASPAADISAAPTTSAVPSPPSPSSSSISSTNAPATTKNQPLSDTIGRLFGTPDAPQPVDVQVSYRVDKYVDQIVTVFTDPKTGKEIAQFPKEIMIQIAQFFDKQSGVTLDHNA
jgi:uncharacterized FlaG/YvyC family protein